MPTGYTAPVQDGTITEFRDFALRCARAFGALIQMRDDPMDAAIPDKFEPSDYYAKALAEDERRLAELLAMKPSDIVQAHATARAKLAEQYREWNADKDVARERYEAMLAKVETWVSPTADHDKFKKFMVEQLRESIDHDCKHYELPPEQTPGEWYAEELKRVRRAIVIDQNQHADEVRRAAERTAWVWALKESLVEPEPVLVG